MSVNITVGNGQGITQAIKSKLQADGTQLKNVKLSDWQKVMDLVNQNQQQISKFNAESPNTKKDSIFTGGNNTSRISQNNGDNNWKSDFKISAGQTMQIDSGIFAQIKAILTGVQVKEPEDKNEGKKTPNDTMLELPKMKPTEVAKTPEVTVPKDVNRAVTENQIENLGGKIITREVNGEKKEISVATVDGQKVRREVNEDGTLGDNLVPVSTLGKNKYITQTEMDDRIKNVFPEGLPEGVTANYVNIGGTPTLVFKKDGKTLDQEQLKEMVKSNTADNSDDFIKAESNPPALETGPSPKENPNYDKNIHYNPQNSSSEKPVSTYDYDNDTMYNKMSEALQKLESDINKFEKQNNITKEDKFSEADAMSADGYVDYSFNKDKYRGVKSDLDSYKNVMDKWKDGFKAPAYRQKRTVNGRNILNVNYTNIECITLKNGQRAYKTDQGTFYPYNNGNPGDKPVPDQLLNGL